MNLRILPRVPFFASALAVSSVFLACSSSSQSAPVEVFAGADAGAPAFSNEDGGPSDHPILAPVDTGQAMNVSPGAGVGVFAEYDSGGLWHVYWTCGPEAGGGGDPPCQFDVSVSVASGAITQPTTQGFLATDTFTSSPTRLEGITTTTSTFDSMTFTTAPGAVITLSATVGGVYDGRFLFFVEGGQIDDGAPWLVTDPVM